MSPPSHTPRADMVTTNPAGEVNIGPIPLPVVITPAIFIPSIVAFLVWFIYLKTVKRYKDSKILKVQEAGGVMPAVSEDVEMQVRLFLEGRHGG
ncbi:hypothetical protein NX059_002871 [Plenodomus lindquistii]|nr:hypothetical protein NX059_002871 [Plenodomus lindquistii]